MFSLSAFNSKRKMSPRHSTDQVCLSHCQAFFSKFGFCGAAVRAEANSEFPVGTKTLLTARCYIPSFLSSVVSTLQVHSCHFSHSSALLHMVTGSLTLSDTETLIFGIKNTKTFIFCRGRTSFFRGMLLLVSFLLMLAAVHGASHK